MRLTILTQYFHPVDNACSNRMMAFAAGLQRLGHTVTVITGMPNYPDGIKPPRYRHKLFLRETWQGVRVLRTYEFPTANEGRLRRMLNYLSFMCSAVCVAPFLPRQDALIVSTPPLFVTASALLLRCRARRLYCDVRDLWPRSLIELEHARPDSAAIRLLEKLERRIYAASDAVIAASQGTARYVAEYARTRLGRDLPVWFSPNGIGGALTPKPSSYTRDEAAFTVLYAGNHSSAQDLGQFLDFAARLQTETDAPTRRVRLLFVGDGESRPAMLERVAREDLRIVRMLGWVAKEEMYDIMGKCDLGLVSLKDVPLFRGVVPSKTFEYMYFARPILTNVGGELREALDAAGCGYSFAPHDYPSFRAAILAAMQDRDEYAARCQRARDYVLQHYDRETAVRALHERLMEAAR